MEPLLFSKKEEDEPAGDVPAEGDDPGQDESLFPTGRRLDVGRQLVVEPGRRPLQGRTPRLMRRESLESLGGRISRLSQGDALGMAWGGPQPAPSPQPALGREDSPHRGSCSRKDPLTITLHSEDLAGGRPQRAPGISAGRSRAGARRGSPDGDLPGASGAGTRGQPASKPLGLRRQEPPALQGRCGGVVTLSVDDVEKEGRGSRRRRAPCLAHCESGLAPQCWGSAGGGWRDWYPAGGRGTTGPGTLSLGQGVLVGAAKLRAGHGGRDQPQLLMGFVWGGVGSTLKMPFFPAGTDTAAGPPGRCGTGADVSSCPGGAAESRRQGGKQKAVLPCKVRPCAGCALLWGTAGWVFLPPRGQPRLWQDEPGGQRWMRGWLLALLSAGVWRGAEGMRPGDPTWPRSLGPWRPWKRRGKGANGFVTPLLAASMQRGCQCRCVGPCRGARRGRESLDLVRRGLGAKGTEPGTLGAPGTDPALRLETELRHAHRCLPVPWEQKMALEAQEGPRPLGAGWAFHGVSACGARERCGWGWG